VVVNGPPAAGKTTLARALARDLRFPLLAKDDLKETLFDSLGTGDRDWSRRLGVATFDLLYLLAERQLEAGRSAVLEANWDAEYACPRFTRQRERLEFRLVEVYVNAPDAVLRRRFDERSASGERHPGHLDTVVAGELERGEHAGRWHPLPCADERLDVDATTLDGLAQDLAGRVRPLLDDRADYARAP
jgi:predicted kinase